MSHVIIDRRLSDKGKSSVNRRKFIGRVRSTLKEAVKKTIANTDLKDLATGKGKVRIPVKNLDEPHFHHDSDVGEHHRVIPGNEKYRAGDKLPRPTGGKGQGTEGSPDGEGEDGFEFHLTKEEFMDLFFENCALPNLFKKSYEKLLEEEKKRAGYVSDGPPSQLNIVRSMRQAKGRRFGLRASIAKKLRAAEEREEELEQEIRKRMAAGEDCSIEHNAVVDLRKKIEVLRRRLRSVPFIDPMDLRYTNYVKQPLPAVQAVMFCVMDVSGSMDEDKKNIAKTFFLLLYLFLLKNYERVDIRYIRHHVTAAEVDEQEFYHSQESGGTVVSSALDLTHELIREHYPLNQWNVYIAQASDGDNYPEDNKLVTEMLTEKLLPICQYFAYVQANPVPEGRGFTGAGWNMGGNGNLWEVYKKLGEAYPNLGTGMISSEKDVYPAFVKLFEKKEKVS